MTGTPGGMLFSNAGDGVAEFFEPGTGLQRCDVAGRDRADPAGIVEQRAVGLVLGPPKSRAGVRTGAVIPALQQHLSPHVGEATDAFVFTGQSGRTVWFGTFNKLVKWSATVAPGLHFHDLGTPAKHSRPARRGRACAMSWPGWVTTAQGPR